MQWAVNNMQLGVSWGVAGTQTSHLVVSGSCYVVQVETAPSGGGRWSHILSVPTEGLFYRLSFMVDANVLSPSGVQQAVALWVRWLTDRKSVHTDQ